MKVNIKKDKDSYIAIDGRTSEVIITSKDYDELANAIYNSAVQSYSSGDLNKFKKTYFRKIINLVDKKQNTSFYLGETNYMKKSELKQLIKEALTESKYVVTWTDRDYKEHKKIFTDSPSGPPENGLVAAKKFLKSLEDKDAKDNYGLYRTLRLNIL